jgi:ribosomal protein S27E
MSVAFPCPGCGSNLILPDQLAGRSTRCPTCSQVLVVPGAGRHADDEIQTVEMIDDSDGIEDIQTRPVPNMVLATTLPPKKDSGGRADDAPSRSGNRVKTFLIIAAVSVIGLVLVGGAIYIGIRFGSAAEKNWGRSLPSDRLAPVPPNPPRRGK